MPNLIIILTVLLPYLEIEKVGGFMNLFEQIEGLSQVTRIYITAAAAAENFQALLKNITVKTFFET
jgi:hypothetical protein